MKWKFTSLSTLMCWDHKNKKSCLNYRKIDHEIIMQGEALVR